MSNVIVFPTNYKATLPADGEHRILTLDSPTSFAVSDSEKFPFCCLAGNQRIYLTHFFMKEAIYLLFINHMPKGKVLTRSLDLKAALTRNNWFSLSKYYIKILMTQNDQTYWNGPRKKVQFFGDNHK